jgi:elongator complex protein 3
MLKYIDLTVKKEQDIEDIISDVSINIAKNSFINEEEKSKLKKFVNELLFMFISKIKIENEGELGNRKNNNNLLPFINPSAETPKKSSYLSIYNQIFNELRKKYDIFPKKSKLNYVYRLLKFKKEITPNIDLENILITKKMRSESGVLVISVIMPPDNFSCTYDCSYCPNDPTYSRSYYKGEPTVQRGERNNFDAYKQFFERSMCLFINGHNIDKVEIIILGGTFSCYDPKISENFIKELYYAANNVFEDQLSLRSSLSIEEEMKLNEDALCHIIGVTIETRPDKISRNELRRFRKYGVTRIQMGVQHTDDAILEKVNRQCTQKQIIHGIKLAKDNCFKVDIHIMPDLPGSSCSQDKEMIDTIINDPDYQADQWKIYPTNVLEFTEIKKWYDEGSYKPYAESNFEDFLHLMIYAVHKTPPWIRINRIQRDFPGNYIEGGNKITNLRQVIHDKMKEYNLNTNDIRSMEVKSNVENIHKARLVRIDYTGSSGHDVFLSHKSCSCKFCWTYFFFKIKQFLWGLFGFALYFYGCGNEDTIYSFLRLRLTNDNYSNCFSDIYRKKAKIRELHVYGSMSDTYSKNNNKETQHIGLGRQLVFCAEKIAYDYGYDGTMVISGNGVRNYYRKLGYDVQSHAKNNGGFMVKDFYSEENKLLIKKYV